MSLTTHWPRIVSLTGLTAMVIVSAWAMEEAENKTKAPEDKTVLATRKIPPLDEAAAKVKTRTATFAVG
jgi:hypothetical protein